MTYVFHGGIALSGVRYETPRRIDSVLGNGHFIGPERTPKLSAAFPVVIAIAAVKAGSVSQSVGLAVLPRAFH